MVVSQIRVRSEHFFGLLKGRFQSLREMRFQIQNQRDLEFTNMWISEMTLRSNNKRTVEKELSSQVTYGYWGGEAVELGRLRAKTQRELE